MFTRIHIPGLARRPGAPCLTLAALVTAAVALGVPPIAGAGTSSTGGAAPVAATRSGPLRFTNPMRDARNHKPLSCPDPSVIKVHRWKWNYFLFCTSDNARNAIPMWKSTDLVHWYPNGYVFPHGHQPSWAYPSDGHSRLGLFWAPSINRIDNRWTLYFSAVYDPASHAAGTWAPRSGTMVLGVATASALAGPWHTSLLHFPGELNPQNARPNQETIGGDIDPGVVQDPRTGQRYLFWAEQREQIWESELSANGLTVGPSTRIAISVTEPWECDPANRLCTVEGPQPLYHDGRIYVLFSGASTWDGSYAVGAALAPPALNPAQPFDSDPNPVLRSGNGFLGPGGMSAPVIAPNGQTMIMFHALTHVPTTHDSAARVLMLGALNWLDGFPLVDNGVA